MRRHNTARPLFVWVGRQVIVTHHGVTVTMPLFIWTSIFKNAAHFTKAIRLPQTLRIYKRAVTSGRA
jgi:hypothetical protein